MFERSQRDNKVERVPEIKLAKQQRASESGYACIKQYLDLWSNKLNFEHIQIIKKPLRKCVETLFIN